MAKKQGGVSWISRNGARWRPSAAGIALVCLALALAVGALIFQGGENDAAAIGSYDICLAELVSDNRASLVAANGSTPDWIEIENAGDAAVSLKNYALMHEPGISNLFVFPNISLSPGERLIILADGSNTVSRNGELHAPFKLSASGGDALYLLDSSSRVIDAVELPEMDADWAYCRTDVGDWKLSATSTPGERNKITESAEQRAASIQAVAGDVAITEVMSANSLYIPDDQGVYSDYIELHNSSDSAVDLAGWALSDDASRLTKWQFPAVTIPADGYLIVYCSGESRTDNPAQLHANFKLSRSGENVYLTDAQGQVVSAVDVPLLEKNQAWSYVDGDWTAANAPTPGSANVELAAGQAIGRGGELMISEIMAAPSSEACDWIEIYNSGAQAVELSGYGLSNNSKKPRKWQFPQGTVIQPGTYMCVCCAKKEETTLYGMPNTGFALSDSGGYTILLAAPDGTVLDSVFLPQQYDGVSYGRTEAGGDFYYLASGTPGTANAVQRYTGRASMARCSVAGGLYKTGDSFQITLSAPEGCRIYYTLDCSDPTEASTPYTGPISVNDTTILRTRVYRDGWMPSFIDTQSYLYDINNSDSYRIVSLVSDPVNLYSDEKGIMVMGPNAYEKWPYGNYGRGANFWMDWEREAHVELFEPGGAGTAISQGCGIKMHGRHSRTLDVKPMKVIARRKYGAGSFDYPIFSKRDYTQYQSFLLRASGQDYKSTFMRDSVYTALAADSSLMYQESELCVCYLNGEYYSMMYLRERINAYSICQFEGWEGDEAALDIVKGKQIVIQGSNDSFTALNAWLETHDAASREAYEMIDANIDIDNFLEYLVYAGYASETDTFNVKRYRNANADGKWRWIIYDVDRGLHENVDVYTLFADGSFAMLFKACMQNPDIRARYLEIMNRYLATTLSSENVLARFEARWQELQPLFPDYLKKLGLEMRRFNDRRQSLIKSVNNRPAQLIRHCMNYLGMSQAEAETCFADAIAVIRARS